MDTNSTGQAGTGGFSPEKEKAAGTNRGSQKKNQHARQNYNPAGSNVATSTRRQHPAPALTDSLRGSIAASVGKYARQTSILPDRAQVTGIIVTLPDGRRARYSAILTREGAR